MTGSFELWVPVIVSLITLAGVVFTAVGVLVSAYWQRKTHRNTTEINDAVNHRHLKPKGTNGDSPPKMYDLALENNRQLNHIGKKVDGLVEWRMNLQDHVDEMKDDLIKLKKEHEPNDVANR